MQSYTKPRRVFVIVDDLDRCEVPKAAELLQAINLMISGAGEGEIFFLLGMDRHKVASGIAVKNQRLLRYLRAGERPEDRGPNADWYGLKFGYEFIEKLIQIPVVVPRPGDAEVQQYIRSLALAPGAAAQVQRTDGKPIGAAPAPDAPALPVETERRREQFRLEATGDSEVVQQIAARMAPVFDNNPRRVKLFLNLFRLRLLTAVETGLLDEEGPLNIYQLGTFVALSLRWPLLLADLARNPTQIDQAKPRSLEGWTYGASLLELLTDPVYRLHEVPLDKLLRTMPSLRDPFAAPEQDMKPTGLDLYISGYSEEAMVVVQELRKRDIKVWLAQPGKLPEYDRSPANVFAYLQNDADLEQARRLGMEIITLTWVESERSYGFRVFVLPKEIDALILFLISQRRPHASASFA